MSPVINHIAVSGWKQAPAGCRITVYREVIYLKTQCPGAEPDERQMNERELLELID